MAHLLFYTLDVKEEEPPAAVEEDEPKSSGDMTETSLASVGSEEEVMEDEGEKKSREEMDNDESEIEKGEEEEHADEETKAKKLMEAWKSEVRMWRFDL